jgi:hypothetical protein
MVWYVAATAALAGLALLLWRLAMMEGEAAVEPVRLPPELEPLEARLERGDAVDAEDVEAWGRSHTHRATVYCMLKHYERLDLVPPAWRDPQKQAQAMLAYWLVDSGEMSQAPTQIEVVSRHTRRIGEREGELFVLKYLTPGDRWLLGVAGPYFEGDPPYTGAAGAFARRGDTAGSIQGDSLVDRYLRIWNGTTSRTAVRS